MAVQVKICGLNSPAAVRAAGKANFAGFVFYPASPRNVTPATAARLAAQLPAAVKRVALFVDPDNGALERTLSVFHPDLIQLHGKETPARVRAIKRRFGIPVMKAIAVREAPDVDRAKRYADVADWLLFDAKPPKRAGALPGGNAEAFDWTLLQGLRCAYPWMLSGGLTPANVRRALRTAGAVAVDVSSGVEDRPGHKSPSKIKDFVRAARRA